MVTFQARLGESRAQKGSTREPESPLGLETVTRKNSYGTLLLMTASCATLELHDEEHHDLDSDWSRGGGTRHVKGPRKEFGSLRQSFKHESQRQM